MPKQNIIFIVGPTGVGKTDVACHLAQNIKGEIISCDAMQVYREVSIMTGKPSPEILKSHRHHLVGIVSITKEFDVAVFRKKTMTAIDAIHRKEKIPIIVGGSGLYMAILLDGIFQGFGKSDRIRKALEKEIGQKGVLSLYEKLRGADPQTAAGIHPHDSRRIIRALEVFYLSKKPISALQKKRQGLWGKYDIVIFALNRPRENLYQAINTRVEGMFEQGVVEEIKKLLKKKWSKTASGIIGYREIKGYLNGEVDIERAKYLMKLNTRHYAKRQLTWFRRDKRLIWVMIDHPSSAKDIALEISTRILSRR